MRRLIRTVVVRAAVAAVAGIVAEVVNAIANPHDDRRATTTPATRAQPNEEWVDAVARRASAWAHDADIPRVTKAFVARAASVADRRLVPVVSNLVSTSAAKVGKLRRH